MTPRKLKPKSTSMRKSKAPLLIGRDSYSSLNPMPPAGMVLADSYRACSPLHNSFLSKNPPRLYVFVPEAMGEKVPRVRLMASGYLRLGLWRSHKSHETLVLLGGEQDDQGTNLVIMTFKRGELRDVSERFLPSPTAIDFDDLVSSTIESLRESNPGCRIEQCRPLPKWHNVTLDAYHEKTVFLSAIGSSKISQQPNTLPGWLVPVAALGLATAYYGYTVGGGIYMHKNLVSEAESLQSQLQQHSDEGISIAMLEARYAFLYDSTDTGQEPVSRLINIAAAVQSIDGAKITEISSGSKSQPSVAELKVAVPINAYQTSLLQGRQLLDTLTDLSGFSMRIAQHRGVTDTDDERIFLIEVLNA